MTASAAAAALAPHRIVMMVIFTGAVLAGWAILPGSNERVAMLESDGHSREALAILEAEYAKGDRSYRTLYQMQSLYESEGNVAKARETLEAMVEQRPRDAALRGRLATFYKNTQNRPAYIEALKTQVDLKYSEGSCRELIAALRSNGDYAGEQTALQQCRQRGYRRPEDLTRLAELVAADGDGGQAAAILRSIDDLKRLKSVEDRYRLLTLLLEADQPKEAERRALRWTRASKDDTLSLGLIDIMARSKHPETAVAVAKDAGAPGDSISLTVAERLIEQAQRGPAQLYLNGWLDRAAMRDESVAIRFIDAALGADDPLVALKGARKFGLDRLNAPLLQRLAAALSNGGFPIDATEVGRIAGQQPGAEKDLAGAGQNAGEGAVTSNPPEVSAAVASQSPAALGGGHASDPLDGWRRSLWLRMAEDAARRAQALGLNGSPSPPIVPSAGARPGGGHGDARTDHAGASGKASKKSVRILQRTKRIRSLRHKGHTSREAGRQSPATNSPSFFMPTPKKGQH
jgi:tetratricopeptide (TPR) repeat protein